MFGPPHVALEDMMHERQQDAEDDLSEAEEAWQRKEALRTAMASLPQRQRAIVQWTIVEGMTLEMVGQHLGVTKERVRQIREQALRRLREHPEVRRAA
jgi:RNA polymerase sigma factor (sigma-70 family)